MNGSFNHFPNIAAMLEQTCKDANLDIATKAVGHVRVQIAANGQVDTGFMMDSVANEAQGDGSQNVFVGAPYGVYQNYGTRYLPPRPFWEPALDDTQQDIDDAVVAIKAKMEQAGA